MAHLGLHLAPLVPASPTQAIRATRLQRCRRTVSTTFLHSPLAERDVWKPGAPKGSGEASSLGQHGEVVSGGFNRNDRRGSDTASPQPDLVPQPLVTSGPIWHPQGCEGLVPRVAAAQVVIPPLVRWPPRKGSSASPCSC
ncbi:hypothetical protein SEVIR_5G163450v4 [Setaria viridis]